MTNKFAYLTLKNSCLHALHVHSIFVHFVAVLVQSTTRIEMSCICVDEVRDDKSFNFFFFLRTSPLVGGARFSKIASSHRKTNLCLFQCTWSSHLWTLLKQWLGRTLKNSATSQLALKTATIIYNQDGNRIEWSPIRSVIIQVINEVEPPHSGSPICLITSMVTDQIALLPINHDHFNFRENKVRSFFL